MQIILVPSAKLNWIGAGRGWGGGGRTGLGGGGGRVRTSAGVEVLLLLLVYSILVIVVLFYYVSTNNVHFAAKYFHPLNRVFSGCDMIISPMFLIFSDQAPRLCLLFPSAVSSTASSRSGTTAQHIPLS